MASRDTSTGSVLEATVLPALKKHYSYRKQVTLPELSLGGRKHRIDVLIDKPDTDAKQILLSIKWQGGSGTAEEKVPFEIIKLIHAVENGHGKYVAAYIVLAGPGFSNALRTFYFSGELANYIIGYEKVKIISLETFIGLANQKRL